MKAFSMFIFPYELLKINCIYEFNKYVFSKQMFDPYERTKD